MEAAVQNARLLHQCYRSRHPLSSAPRSYPCSTQPSPEWEAMLRALDEDPTAGELVDARPAHPGERAAQGAGRFLGDAAAIQEGAEDAPGAERADRGGD